MSKALSLRRKGQLPLSVATSIAIESLLNMTPTEDASPHVRVPKGDRKPSIDFKELPPPHPEHPGVPSAAATRFVLACAGPEASALARPQLELSRKGSGNELV